MELSLPVIAGATSTVIFALRTLPMLRKAFQTKDLRSYSLGNILLANTGNVVHSVYVFDLPPGPIWLLHSFYLITTGLMLLWYLRYESRPSLPRARCQAEQDYLGKRAAGQINWNLAQRLGRSSETVKKVTASVSRTLDVNAQTAIATKARTLISPD